MSQKIVVKSFSSKDLKAVQEILFRYPSPTGRIWNEDMVKQMIDDALTEQPDGVFVAEIGGKVVGFAIVVYREWFEIAYLDYIQTKAEWTKKGIGHRLIQKCVSWAGEKGARIIYTETGRNNDRAIEFYKKHDFRITGCIPDYYQKKLDAVILVKRLCQQQRDLDGK